MKIATATAATAIMIEIIVKELTLFLPADPARSLPFEAREKWRFREQWY
jgi:hypothetical protein